MMLLELFPAPQLPQSQSHRLPSLLQSMGAAVKDMIRMTTMPLKMKATTDRPFLNTR
jgi:hypothetical protein